MNEKTRFTELWSLPILLRPQLVLDGNSFRFFASSSAFTGGVSPPPPRNLRGIGSGANGTINIFAVNFLEEWDFY